MKSAWPTLFHTACQILDHVQKIVPIDDQWSLGGGTALMLWLDHRESYDIDIFIHDSQLLSFMNPELNDFELDTQYAGFQTDGSRFSKFDFGKIGQIDFICSLPLLKDWADSKILFDRNILLEKPAEIIAKKLVLRGERLQPRDIFDTAATLEHYGFNQLLEQLKPLAFDMNAALGTLRRLDRHLVSSVINGLNIRPSHRYLAHDAADITNRFLGELLELR